MKYDLEGVLARMIRANKENEKRAKILRESPIVIRQRAREEKKRPKPSHDLVFEGMM